jgi:TonB family protein
MKRTEKLWRLVVTAMIGLLTLVQVEQAKGNDGGTPVEALRTLVTAALAAAQAGDQPKMEDIAHSMIIPDYETWFKATFGEETGLRLAAAYKADSENQEKWLPTLFATLAKQDGEILVEDVREPGYTGAGSWCGHLFLRAAKNDASFYNVSLEQLQQDGSKRTDHLGYFAFVDGAYRRLDCKSLGLFALRVGGNVQAAKLINRVQPVYPEAALIGRISGNVRLRVLLSKEGTVEQIEVVSGHPLLLKAALDAVRQWIYQPTLLNGEPVKIDTTVDLVFSQNLPAPNA